MTADLQSMAARVREFITRCTASVFPASKSGDVEFTELALNLFALQFEHNLVYRRICESRGVKPDSVEHWSRIPAVPTAAFKDFEMTCLALEDRTSVFHSSGTTTLRPSRHFHNAQSLKLYEASLWPWFERHVLAGMNRSRAGGNCVPDGRQNIQPAGSSNGWRLAILTPAPTLIPNSSLVHMFETVRCKVGATGTAYLGDIGRDGTWTLNGGLAESVLRSSIVPGNPLVLLGTAFSFVHLLDALVARNVQLRLPPGSVVMETGGYKGRSRELPKAELHGLITRHLGVPRSQTICEYGMSELSSQAYDGMATGDGRPVNSDRNSSRHPARVSRHFTFPPWARAQIISPETGCEVADGEMGLVRVLDLANTFSVLAVQTEDLAIRRGDGFELTGRAAIAEPRGCSLMATETPQS